MILCHLLRGVVDMYMYVLLLGFSGRFRLLAVRAAEILNDDFGFFGGCYGSGRVEIVRLGGSCKENFRVHR